MNGKAFSMLTAIFIIVLMATIAAFIMNLSGKMVKGTTVQFQREQSVLLGKKLYRVCRHGSYCK